MDEKESYTPYEMALIYYATLELAKVGCNTCTTLENLRMYEKIVPKNIQKELTNLSLMEYSRRYSLLEEEARKGSVKKTKD